MYSVDPLGFKKKWPGLVKIGEANLILGFVPNVTVISPKEDFYAFVSDYHRVLSNLTWCIEIGSDIDVADLIKLALYQGLFMKMKKPERDRVLEVMKVADMMEKYTDDCALNDDDLGSIPDREWED